MSSDDERSAAWTEAVDQFPEKVRPEIDRLWDGPGSLSAAQVEALAGQLGIGPPEIGSLMMKLLPVARQFAVVPVSGYPVGAVSAGMPVAGSGWCSLYFGANFEFREAALSFTVHAEQCATNNAWLHGEVGLQALAISAAPCGYCRQFLYELVTAKELAILLPDTENPSPGYTTAPLTTFLPDAFGPGDLNVKGGLMDPAVGGHSLVLESGPAADAVVQAALDAASKSYAPYKTGASYGSAGVAVELADGTVHAGRHAENAAYNPSLSPMQSALTAMHLSRSPGADRGIVRCVLVEVPTLASQKSATAAVLAAYAPGVELEYHAAALS